MTAYFDKFCGSQFWDVNLTWHTEQPDLTPCFGKTILLWIPGIFLVLFLPLELCTISRSRTKHIPWSWLNISKVVVVGLMMAVTVANLTYTMLRGEHYPADIAAPLLQLFIFVVIMSLVILHKGHGRQVSYFLFFISLILVIFETPYLYTTIINYPNLADMTGTALRISVYALQGIFLFLQWFCDKKPLYSEYPNLERPSPEGSASVFSRLTLTWFTPFVQLGSKKALQASDMFSLDHENSSRVIVPAFEKNWNTTLQNNQNPKVNYDKRASKVGFYQTIRPKASLLPALFKTFGPTLLFGSMLKLFQDIVLFVNPQLLKLLIQFVSSEEPMWKGYTFACLMFIASLAQMFLLNRYFLTMNFLGCRVYSALVSVVYKKALRLSNTARKQSTLGEIVNLMAVDAAGFQQMIVHLNLLWSAPFQIFLAIYFIYQLLGVAVFAGLAVMILMIPLNIWLVRQNRVLQMKQMKKKDERIKTLNEVLSGIKVLKLYAWEQSFEEKISNIRKNEVDILKKSILFMSIGGFLVHLSPFLVALASFSCYVLTDEKNILDAETAFVSLSLFNILRMPLNMLPQVLNALVTTSVALNRLNHFLNNEELNVNAVQHESFEKDPIVVEDGTFSWDRSDDSSVVLRNISLSVPQGSLVAVVGSVGSGKSSLISAILGEMDKLSGRVNTKGKIAYVPQQAWMQNASLQRNITCVQDVDKVFLRKVVRACALEHDLEVLPGGYDTEIGEKGINLSGGQKQRISLARAVYSNADVYLLDDPLSAVDSHVGKHIFDSVIGPKGILRKKTRVLVTHGVTFLPETDYIVVLKDGQVSESGNYKQLVANKGDFADFLLQYLAESDEVDGSLDLEGIKEELLKDSSLREKYQRAISVRSEGSHKSLQRQISSESSTHEGSVPSVLKESKTSLNKEKGNEKTQHDKRQLMTVEEAATGSVKLSVFLYYLRAIGLGTACAGMLGYICYQLLSAGSNLWLSEWTSDNTTVVNGTQDTSKTHFYLSVYGSFGILLTVCNVVAQLSVSLGCLYAAAWLHTTMLHHLLKAPMSYFDTTPLGRIVNRFSKDITSCDNILAFNISVFLNLGTQLVATVAVISFSMPLFIVVIVPVMIFNLFLQRFFVATSRQLKRLESTTKSPIYSHFGETVQGAQSIRAYNMQEFFIAESEQKMDLHQSCNFPNMVSMRWLAIRLESASNLIVFFTALFSVVYRGDLDPGLAGLSVAYALQITGTLNFFVRTSADVETNIVSVERIKEYTEIVQEKETASKSVEPKPEPAWPRHGKIELRDFRVRYRDGLELVLDGVSFTVQPGEKVGIVGRTGAGKSSLTLALFRILEAAGGAIYIDGVNIASVELHHLRSRLTIIPQDPVLFSGSLRSNLDPFNKESDQALWRALELSNLKHFVSSLPAGLNHQISEGGDNLSVGQKQLVCLSRALLRKTQVLVLDEATAAVDLETDDVIQKTIRSEFKDCTILTIAHRLNTIMDYDRILVLERGKVKEFDSPDKLLKDPTTVFHSMAKDAGLVS